MSRFKEDDDAAFLYICNHAIPGSCDYCPVDEPTSDELRAEQEADLYEMDVVDGLEAGEA